MELEDRREQIDQARKFVFTHAEVKKILDGKRKQGALRQSNVLQRAQLMRYRDYHLEMQEMSKVQEYESKIKELEAKADAQRRAQAPTVLDKQAAAREMHLRAEYFENLIQRRRPRVLEKFERKLEKLPPDRRPRAMLGFYGPNHPRCVDIQSTELKRPQLAKASSPEPPPLPEAVIVHPDLEHDLKDDKELIDDIVQLAEGLSDRAVDGVIGRHLLEKWNGSDDWEKDIEKGVAAGRIRVESWPKTSPC